MRNTYRNTRAALAAFDLSAPARKAAWAIPDGCGFDYEAAAKADADALASVHEAYALDTGSELAHCVTVELEWIREMAHLGERNEGAEVAQRGNSIRQGDEQTNEAREASVDTTQDDAMCTEDTMEGHHIPQPMERPQG